MGAENAYFCPNRGILGTGLVKAHNAVSPTSGATFRTRRVSLCVGGGRWMVMAGPGPHREGPGGLHTPSDRRSTRASRGQRGRFGNAEGPVAPAGCAGEIHPGTRNCIPARIAASSRTASAGVASSAPPTSVR